MVAGTDMWVPHPEHQPLETNTVLQNVKHLWHAAQTATAPLASFTSTAFLALCTHHQVGARDGKHAAYLVGHKD